jgi:xylulokinase
VTDLLLGVDLGTSSSKALLARPGGTIVAEAQRPHRTSFPRPGWVEHDAEEVWWADLVALCAELAPHVGAGVAGLCVSGIGPCLLAADAEGRPLRPAILYGVDTRAEREIAELTEHFGAEAILAHGGSPLSSQAVGPKLLWLRRNEPEVWARTKQLLMPNSFVIERLTGAYVLDHHSASQCDPLYDIRACRWSAAWTRDVAPGLRLPELLWPHEVAGRVLPGRELPGVPAGTPVAVGSIDAWMEALSVGVRAPGDVMLMYGTTMMVVEVVEELRPHAGLWGTTGVFPGTYTLSAGMATSGALTGWFRDVVGGLPYEQLVAEAAEAPPGADGLVVLPYFAGERSPLADPRARGMVLGLTVSHTRGHLYRALLEATGYGVRHILETLREAGAEERRVVAAGGGTKGGLWPRIVSDATGVPQQIPRTTIGASFGDALLAAIAAGLATRETTWNQVVDTVEPNVAHAELYGRLYRLFRELYPATRNQMHALAELQIERAGG